MQSAHLVLPDFRCSMNGDMKYTFFYASLIFCHVYEIHLWCLTWFAHRLWHMMSYDGSVLQMHLPIILDSNWSCSIWASINTISVDIPTHVSWSTCVFISSGYVCRNGISRTEGVHTPISQHSEMIAGVLKVPVLVTVSTTQMWVFL